MNDINKLRASKMNLPPIEVSLFRGTSVESIHKAHAVVCDRKGRVLMSAGRADYETFIRSALKPFQALPFISSGASATFNSGERGIAIACASHSGSVLHARESFKILWNSEVDVSYLQCPTPANSQSRLEHNCSGKHAAFLSTCKKMHWPLESYLNGKHPLQKEIFRRTAELLALPMEELIAERDDCGAPTLKLQIAQMALLYAHIGSSKHAELEQISRSILSNPDLIAGEGKFDTELVKRGHGQLISKGGAEGVLCLSRIGEGMGIAIKVEDGSKRAKHAVALHLLRQLEWLTPTALQELETKILHISPGVQLVVNGELRFHKN